MEFEDNRLLEEDHVYKELFNFLEKIFRSHYLKMYDTFDNTVWFLNNDPEFYSNKVNCSLTPNSTFILDTYNLMHQILENISANGNDFKKLKVNVSSFIRAYIIELMKIQKQRIKIGQKIMSFNIDENVNIIQEKIFKLEADSDYTKTESFLKFNLIKSENLPEGEYDCNLYVKKSKKNSLVDKGIVDNEVVISSIATNLKIIRRNNDFRDGKDYSFPKIKITPVEIRYNEFKPDEDILKVFSGTNINSFLFEFKNKQDNIVYKTKNEDIIDIYLKLIDYFNDLTRINHDCMLNINVYEEYKKKSLQNDIKISVNLNLTIDNSVRKYILERIHYIFKLSISYRTMVENNLHIMLKYFDSHAKNIKKILEKENVEHKSCCDGGCLVC